MMMMKLMMMMRFFDCHRDVREMFDECLRFFLFPVVRRDIVGFKPPAR
jgi:hypothetical protein